MDLRAPAGGRARPGGHGPQRRTRRAGHPRRGGERARGADDRHGLGGDLRARARLTKLAALLAAAAALAVGCAAPPEPDAPLPRNPDALAERLTQTDRALGEAIARWRSEGDLESYPPPADVTLWALHQQRIHLLLTPRKGLAGKVTARLAPATAAHLNATFRARRGLGKITPATPGRYRTGAPEPPARLLAYYRRAQQRFGVGWPVLAAINFVESAFGRLRNSSAAGAQGPMQFIPSTWETYGLGGDINDPRDAILGAANYLHANGAPSRLRNALYRYNPSDLYVNAVLAYAERIRRDPDAFLAYYSWQVFVRLRSGTQRITGP